MLKPKYVVVGGPYELCRRYNFRMCSIKSYFHFDVDVEYDTLIIFYGDGTSDMTTFIGAPIIHSYTQLGVYVPFMQLIKWVYNSASKMEKCPWITLKDSIWVIQLKPDFTIEPLL